MNVYDKVLQFGSKKARARGMALNKLSRNRLEDIYAGSGPLVFGFGPIDMVDPGSLNPSIKTLDTVYVAAVQPDNQYVVHHFVPGRNEWVETDASTHQPTALVGVLVQDHKAKTREVEDLKSQLSQLRMEHEILRHEYERLKLKSPIVKPFKPLKVLLFSLLLGLLFAGVTNGARTGTCYAYDEEKDTCLYWEWKDSREVAWYDSYVTEALAIYNRACVYVRSKEFMTYLSLVFQTVFNWYFCATALAVYYMARAENPIVMFVTLALATLSQFQLLAVAVLPLLDFSATMGLWLSMVVFYMSQQISILVSFCVLVLSVMIGTFMADSEYAMMIKGHAVVFAIVCYSHVAMILNIPPWVVSLTMVCYRLWRVCFVFPAERLEIRSADGKVLHTVPTHPNWTAKVTRFVQSLRKGLRTSVAPTARIVPDGIAIVEAREGVGTCFRVKNNLVTSKHVVGSDDAVKIRWGAQEDMARVTYRHPTKDIALMALPTNLQTMPAYKFAKAITDGPIVMTAFDEANLLLVAVTEGVRVEDHMTYSVATRNGMSGAPITTVDGRVIAVHQTNTGFTGGAVIFVPEDIPEVRKISKREQELEDRVKQLEGMLNMDQAYVDSNLIVDLVREAVQREMKVLRTELANLGGFSQKKKGKNKSTKRKRKAVWTEEEYKAMLEKGFTRDQLRIMADAIRDQYYDDEDEQSEEEAGYPDWSDPGDSTDIENEWFGYEQSWKELEPAKSGVVVNTLPKDLVFKYSLDNYPISKQDIQAVAKELKIYEKAISDIISTSVSTDGKWKDDVDAQKILQELDGLWWGINHTLWEHGLMPFTQRRKRVQQPKKLQRGPEDPGPEECKLDYWEQLVEPSKEKFLVPPEYPLLGVVPLDRPISDFDAPVDNLLALLPEPESPDLGFEPAVWGPEAYVKSFEKFDFADPDPNIEKNYPREWAFANLVLHREFDFLADSVVKDITATSKNSESTPGFPKTYWWKTEAEYLAKRGYADYVSEWNRIRGGARPNVLWYLFLKKEILKSTKVRDADIRQIICSDPIFARIGCCFEEDQNERMKRRTKTRMPQCGWSPFFGGFNDRIQRLVAKGNPYWIEFDWTRYDGTIPSQIFKHIKNFRFSMLAKEYQTPELRNMYHWYVDNILRRYVCMPSGEITIQHKGNPSGQVSTTMDNNLVNVFLQAFEYAYLHPEKSMDELRKDWESYDSLIYGDDRLTTSPSVPNDYVTRVVAMYKDIFGMWVKPEKVKVSHSPVGLSFCGFVITHQDGQYLPVPAEEAKLLASLLRPTKKLENMDALYGKLLCYRILNHNLPNDNKFRNYILVALEVMARHYSSRGEEPPFYVTESMLDKLWRGGPKFDYG
uniref:Non-structural polyprotein 1AB n=1 Tax=Ovine astrovirus 1 TaxID=1239577 RepID=NS1AB_OASV1|nr:RecName: Full=Non-structural polyprotein 1AB; Contains: RecName: Full=VPg; Contains: RecName: Full=Protein p19; Contains: RecName: Full=Transmembrane protein 1A; Contains: RecName: Full=Serine protease p27; Short=p27; Contains: RecName: Full=Protein p20; Contains: RecName: Full=RNA-directed RNA polymerase p57; Short=p57 [Mamastrovirus 13]